MHTLKKLPSIDRLRQLFEYDEKTGELKRLRQDKIKVANGDRYLPSTKDHPRGYNRVNIDGQAYPSHRVCWALYFNEDPYPLEIDHKDGNKTNNRITNLRAATRSQQCAAKASSMGYYWRKRDNIFVVATKLNRRMIHIGQTHCPLIARIMYIDKMQEMWGDFCPPFLPSKPPLGRPFPLPS